MKKRFRLITTMLVIILLATGCGTIDPGSNTSDQTTTDKDIVNDNITDKNEDSGTGEEEETVKFKAEVIESGDSLLIAPEQESNEAKSSDKISVSMLNAKITNQEGKEITGKDLKPGDILEITYNGVILESYPAQITASELVVIDHNLVIDGYLAIIDDIYQEDKGLNADIELLTLDTTEWVELTAIQKEIIFTSLKEAYGLEILSGTFDELAEQGIIDKENLYFENGIHIIISKIKYDSKAKEFNYSIQKWRSGLGAIGADDASAKYKDGEWTIKKGSMWIS